MTTHAAEALRLISDLEQDLADAMTLQAKATHPKDLTLLGGSR